LPVTVSRTHAWATPYAISPASADADSSLLRMMVMALLFSQ
jgi:hypothetical protein